MRDLTIYGGQSTYSGTRAFQKYHEHIMNQGDDAIGWALGTKITQKLALGIGSLGVEGGFRLTEATTSQSYQGNKSIKASSLAMLYTFGTRLGIVLLPGFEVSAAAGGGFRYEEVTIKGPIAEKSFSDDLSVFAFYLDFAGRYHFGGFYTELLYSSGVGNLDDDALLLGLGLPLP